MNWWEDPELMKVYQMEKKAREKERAVLSGIAIVISLIAVVVTIVGNSATP